MKQALVWARTNTWRDWVAGWLFMGVFLFIAAHFSAFSNKAINNVFYLAVLLPTVVLMRKAYIKDWLSSPIIRVLIVYLMYTASMWWLVGDSRPLKYSLYVLFFSVAIYQLKVLGIFRPNVLAYFFFAVCLVYVGGILLDMYLEKGKLPYRPFFYEWHISIPIFICAVIAVSFSAAANAFYQSQRYALIVIAIAVIVWLMLLYKTRTGFAGLAVAFACFLLIQMWLLNKKGKIVLIVFFSSATCVGLYLYFSGILDPLFSRGSSYRFTIWQILWNKMELCSLLVGCGYDHDVTGYKFTKTVAMKHPHSIYIAQLFYSGFVGLFLLIGLITTTVYQGIKHNAVWLYAFITGCGVFLVDGWGLISPPREITWLLFWLPLVMVNASLVHHNKRPNS